MCITEHLYSRRLGNAVCPSWASGISAFRVILIILTAYGSSGRAFAEQRVPTLEDIIEAYQKHHQALHSLKIQYEDKYTPLVPLEDLIRVGFLASGQSEETICLKGNKFYCRSLTKRLPLDAVLKDLRQKDPAIISSGDAMEKLPPGDFLRRLKQKPLENSETVLVYDGTALHERLPNTLGDLGVDRAVYSVRKTPPRQTSYLPPSYLNWVCYGPEDPSGNDKRNHIPRMFAADTFSVNPNRNKIEGVECVVLESKEQKLWLDPALGFAVRRRDLFRQEKLALQVHCRDFIEVLPGVWLPRQVTRYVIGVSAIRNLPVAYLGKKIAQIQEQVSSIEANKESHDSFFILKPKAGSFVLDRTLPPLDSTGKPMEGKEGRRIRYIQPADSADLQQVVEEAQKVAGASIEREQSKQRMRYLGIGVISGLIVVLATLALRRVWRARRLRSGS